MLSTRVEYGKYLYRSYRAMPKLALIPIPLSSQKRGRINSNSTARLNTQHIKTPQAFWMACSVLSLKGSLNKPSVAGRSVLFHMRQVFSLPSFPSGSFESRCSSHSTSAEMIATIAITGYRSICNYSPARSVHPRISCEHGSLTARPFGFSPCTRQSR